MLSDLNINEFQLNENKTDYIIYFLLFPYHR